MRIKSMDDKLIIFLRDKVKFIEFSSIDFIERLDQKSLIYINDKIDNVISIRSPLKDIIEFLPDDFKRTHRSFIVNLKNIKELRVFNENNYEAIYPEDKIALISKSIINELF